MIVHGQHHDTRMAWDHGVTPVYRAPVALAKRLPIAATLDRFEARARRVIEKAGWPQAWLQEFQTYLAEPRMTMEEFWVRYTLKRIHAQPIANAVTSAALAESFYTEHDYMLWRNLVHRRHTPWRRVLVTMAGVSGTLLEVGCGIAPVSTYCAGRKPTWCYALHDFDGPHRRYGRWRVDGRARWMQLDWPHSAEVITALDVFEHCADPLELAERCVTTLAPGGVLHWNFVGNPLRNDLDLATVEQERATISYLMRELDLVWERDGYRVSRRPHVICERCRQPQRGAFRDVRLRLIDNERVCLPCFYERSAYWSTREAPR